MESYAGVLVTRCRLRVSNGPCSLGNLQAILPMSRFARPCSTPGVPARGGEINVAYKEVRGGERERVCLLANDSSIQHRHPDVDVRTSGVWGHGPGRRVGALDQVSVILIKIGFHPFPVALKEGSEEDNDATIVTPKGTDALAAAAAAQSGSSRTARPVET